MKPLHNVIATTHGICGVMFIRHKALKFHTFRLIRQKIVLLKSVGGGTWTITFVFVVSAQWRDGGCGLLHWHWFSHTTPKYSREQTLASCRLCGLHSYTRCNTTI